MAAEVENVIIVGSGPAGYTAALYTARANLRPLVIEGFMWGGLLQQTTDVENFPGYPEGVMGPKMMQDLPELPAPAMDYSDVENLATWYAHEGGYLDHARRADACRLRSSRDSLR